MLDKKGGLFYAGKSVWEWWQRFHLETHCAAIREAILDEATELAATVKFPSEQTTDRWKSLAGGCNGE